MLNFFQSLINLSMLIYHSILSPRFPIVFANKIKIRK